MDNLFQTLSVRRSLKAIRLHLTVLCVTGLLLVTGTIGLFLLNPTPALAAPGVTIASITPYALVDNQASNCTNNTAPHAMYLQVIVTNTSGSLLTNLRAALSFQTAGFALAGGQPASIYLGSLAAGAGAPVFWYVTYPCTYGTIGNYTVAVTDNTSGATSFSGILTTRSELTASAGGNIYTAVLGPGIFVGQVVTYLVTYSFGNAWQPNSSNAQIQPAGNLSFRADCFQLLGDSIDSSSFTAGIVPGNNNRLYFPPTVNSQSTNNLVVVTYRFRVLCSGTTSPVYPYSDLESGSQQQKYTGNYGTACTAIPCTKTLPPPVNSVSCSKTASAPSVASGGTVTFTVRIDNSGSVPALLDQINDTLPTSSQLSFPKPTYLGVASASSVQSTNSSSAPPVGSTGPVSFISSPGQSWSVPANGSINLVYSVSFPSATGQATFINTASALVGNSQVSQCGVGAGFDQPTAVTLTSFGAQGLYESVDIGKWLAALTGTVMACIACVAIWRSRRS